MVYMLLLGVYTVVSAFLKQMYLKAGQVRSRTWSSISVASTCQSFHWVPRASRLPTHHLHPLQQQAPLPTVSCLPSPPKPVPLPEPHIPHVSPPSLVPPPCSPGTFTFTPLAAPSIDALVTSPSSHIVLAHNTTLLPLAVHPLSAHYRRPRHYQVLADRATYAVHA